MIPMLEFYLLVIYTPISKKMTSDSVRWHFWVRLHEQTAKQIAKRVRSYLTDAINACSLRATISRVESSSTNKYEINQMRVRFHKQPPPATPYKSTQVKNEIRK